MQPRCVFDMPWHLPRIIFSIVMGSCTFIYPQLLVLIYCEGAGKQFGVITMLGTDHLKPGVVVPVHKTQEQKTLSKSEQKRLAKKKGKEDPTKPPPEQIVEGAVDYSKDFHGQRANLTVSGF